ncbi:BolA/IbaG family iron-sulfur metabolism protein [Tumidithrix elongata RA019]|jgi:acid stress-induced BolA-like protein IbaG/YrbA|uniref:BolA/IbaG family iron-sulfur metabolism protein n=1 Tax=Tumidithrix elongata BACA0141 TaxID=2716417 RepID=A0AAW9Q7C5_9CYAN|nr:BolA/IbaG family iron-sulfur metabolism protein [Tumidithrix elongata RA019]
MSTSDIQSLILKVLPDALVDVQDPNQDGQHFAATVVSGQFVGLTMVKQHKLVYDAIKPQLDSGVIHAMQLKTYTPEKWQANSVQFG